MDGAQDYMASFEAQNKSMLAAKARKGQRATNKPSRAQVASSYPTTSTGKVSTDSQPLRTALITFSYPPSTIGLQDLEPIKLGELRLETHHTGRVLFVRTFTHPKRLVSVLCGIEDEAGEIDHLELYNSNPKLKPSGILPKDAVFAVKEPFYKASSSEGYLIRIDHPSDLIRLPNTHDLVPLGLQPRLVELDKTADAYKLDGNKAYKAKDYLTALASYTQGVSMCGEDDTLLRSDLLRNRSIANLYLQRYESAETDAKASIVPGFVFTQFANNTKAYYRAGCAAYHQGKFKEALALFQMPLMMSPGEIDCLREVKRTEARLSEQTEGKYDLAAISKAASKKHNRMDHASFLQNVEVRQAGSKGRGLFATNDLQAGDLIMCEKAFLVSFSSDSEVETYHVLNLNSNIGSFGAQATLIFNLTQKMLHNPVAAAKYFDLYSGKKQKFTPIQVDGVTVVDTFETAAIIENNAFSCPDVRSTATPEESERDCDPRCACGIWITASYTNHACDGNAARSFIGDLVIIRATKDIARGTEITMPYRIAHADPIKNRDALQKGWDFKCECDFCVTQGKTGGSHLSKRRELVEEAEAFMKDNKQTSGIRPGKDVVAVWEW